MAYDRADWHYGGEFPGELPDEAGGTHIGMFLGWAIVHDLVGPLLLANSRDALSRVKKREMTGRDFLFAECDEKFWEDDLSEEGNAFAGQYYNQAYLEDYEKLLSAGLPTLYHVEDTWKNFDKIDPVITRAWIKWQKRSNRRWWKLWQ